MKLTKNVLTAIENGDVKLVKAELFYDNVYTPKEIHYLKVEYRIETEGAIYRVICPCVRLPLCTDSLPIYNKSCSKYDKETYEYVGVGYGEQLVPKTTPGILIEEVEKKTHKMTLAEIEEKLGYKVELVSEKEEKA